MVLSLCGFYIQTRLSSENLVSQKCQLFRNKEKNSLIFSLTTVHFSISKICFVKILQNFKEPTEEQVNKLKHVNHQNCRYVVFTGQRCFFLYWDFILITFVVPGRQLQGRLWENGEMGKIFLTVMSRNRTRHTHLTDSSFKLRVITASPPKCNQWNSSVSHCIQHNWQVAELKALSFHLDYLLAINLSFLRYCTPAWDE